MRWAWILLWTACTIPTPDQAHDWGLEAPWTGGPGATQPPPPDFELFARPLRSGETTTARVRGLPPSTVVRIGLSFGGVGDGPCPAILTGCLGILSPAAPWPTRLRTDAHGEASLPLDIPPVPPGMYVALQAVAPQDGWFSNVIGTHIGPAGSFSGPESDFDGDGVTVAQGDCSDTNAQTYPSAFDLPGDGIDKNCDGYDGLDPYQVSPQERHFENVTYAHGRGLTEWLAGNDADIALQPDGMLWKLHVPSALGPGLQIWTLDPSDPDASYVNRTLEMLPTEAGRPGVWPAGVLIDLNGDDWDDIVLVRDKGSHDAHGFLYNQDSGMFEPLPFNEDHDSDSVWVDGTGAFFGNKNVSYHTRSLQRGDFDGDGDDDLFVARRFGNYIFENLTNGTEWGLADVIGSNNQITQRFRAHVLDRIAIDASGALWESIFNEWASTDTHTELWLEGHDQPFIAAVDRTCESDNCAAGRGVGEARFVHVYGLHPDPSACPTANNGLCEEGEMAMGSPDCLGDYSASAEELSCLFTDHLRLPLDDLQPGGIAAVDLDDDGFDDDLVIAPGMTVAARAEVEACFADPSGCGPIDGYGVAYEIRHDQGYDYLAPEVAGAPFDRPYVTYQGMEGLDIDGDGLNELALFAGITPYGEGVLHTYDVAGGVLTELTEDGMRGDLDGATVAFDVIDVDGNGGEDLLVTNVQGERAYLASGPGQPPRLDLHLRYPKYANNMGPPTLVDLDADGDLDIIAKTWADTGFDSALVVAWENDGSGQFVDRSADFADLPIGLGGVIRHIDLDGDGDQDILMSQTGPLLLLENLSAQGQPFVFTDRSDLLPPYYTVGGDIHGKTFDTCYGVTQSPGEQRCYSRNMDIADVDGDGRLDILMASRKGMNDVLFNNVDGLACDASEPWCARTGFLSARTDLGIRSVFPTTDATGYGENNRSQNIRQVSDLTGSGHPDVVVITSPFEWSTTADDALFSNEITALPYVPRCTSDADCTAGESCSSTNGLPDLRTCKTSSYQHVVNGWFEEVAGAFPLRGGASPVAPYATLACSTFGDINGDGYEDVAMMVKTGEFYPQLDGVQSLSHSACALLNTQTGAPCDVYFTCYTNRCVVENPTGLHVGGPASVYPDTDPNCCTQTELTGGQIAAPSCTSAPKSSPDHCKVRGFKYHQALPELRESESEVFFYIFEPASQTFQEYARPIDADEIGGTEAFGCTLVDLDRDGDLDFAHTAYQTSSLAAHRLAHPQLLTSAYYERRRKLGALHTGIWLNPGWEDPLVLGTPFSAGDFVQRTGKDYGFAAGDLDGDGLPELVLTDANTMSVFDDAD